MRQRRAFMCWRVKKRHVSMNEGRKEGNRKTANEEGEQTEEDND